MMNKAVFIDRDGTINEDTGYPGDVRDLKIIPGSIEAVKLLKEEGFLIFIVTNQSGIARGFFETADLECIHEEMRKLFPVDRIFYCPHHPDENCPCRKPKPKMVKDAVAEFNLDLGKSYLIGDALSDLEMGQRAGCRSILVRTGRGKETEAALKTGAISAEFVTDNILEAAKWIKQNSIKEK